VLELHDEGITPENLFGLAEDLRIPLLELLFH